ncbi:CpaD family pilus assembly lipoprotein [Sphingomonas montana]|uniref:CpaD family pilus assembly lipoprotein n=1 Tax=Sphingomonas montana TaxID=1843236 RepID=UPI00096DD220|nr:CpaD family pilus assembly lipoprotein [Sphingomonas montana]
MRALVLSALAGTALAVTGCSSATHSDNRGLESINQPLVSRQDYALDVRAAYDGLADGEDRRLTGWFDSLKVGYGDRVTVDDGANGSRSMQDAIARVAARYGLLIGETPPVTEGQIADGTVRVIVSRSTASVPNCPNWSSASQPYNDGSTDRNYGCATNSNLAAMIADPQDLITGRHGSASLSTRAATRALKAYNELIPTGVAGAVKSEATGGK